MMERKPIGLRRRLGSILGYERHIRDLECKIRELQWDQTFGMWTRVAFIQLCSVMPRATRIVAFVDLDDIHDLNHTLGYPEVDRRIRAAFSIPWRSSDLVSRWYSGDEIVILFDGDEAGARLKMTELEQSARTHGLGFSFEIGTWAVGHDDIVAVVNLLSDRNRRKPAGPRRQHVRGA